MLEETFNSLEYEIAFLDLYLPYWLQAFIPAIVMWIALYVGFRVGLWISRREATSEHETSEDGGLVVSAALGLLSLLFAFTFGFIVSWENTRKTTATEQVLAIGTAFNTASLLDDPGKTKLKLALLEFARTRDLDRPTTLSPDEQHAWLVASRNARQELWSTASEVISGDVPVPVRVAVNGSVNDALDSWARFRNSMIEEVSQPIKIVIIAMSAGAMFLTGYHVARKKGGKVWPWAFIPLLFGLIGVIIFDIEHPKQGWVRVQLPDLGFLITEMQAELNLIQN